MDWDIGNDQLIWSAEVSRIFGRARDVLPPTLANFLSIVHRGDLQRVRDALTATVAHNAPFDLELRIIRPDETERIVHTQAEPTLDEAGKVTRLTGTVHDITQRKRADRLASEELRRTHRQRDIIGKIGQSEALLSGDVEAIARHITELAARATGCERVNVWLFNDAETELGCIDLYESTPRRHSSGMILSDTDFGDEIAIVKASRYVAADDPLIEPLQYAAPAFNGRHERVRAHDDHEEQPQGQPTARSERLEQRCRPAVERRRAGRVRQAMHWAPAA